MLENLEVKKEKLMGKTGQGNSPYYHYTSFIKFKMIPKVTVHLKKKKKISPVLKGVKQSD